MKIIIVEDEKSIRNGLVKMLPKLDPEYEVVGSAKDGSEGYQRILAEQPDLVIMDIEMPEMDGLTMLEKLRKEGFAGKAVVLTAYSDFSYAKRAIELGIENYLLKPIKLEELKKTLGTVSASLRQERFRKSCYPWNRSFVQHFWRSLPWMRNWRSMQKLPTVLTATVPLPF